jgi:hypothetical protein
MALGLLLAALVLVTGAGLALILVELRAARRAATVRALVSAFGPAIARAHEDPRQIPVWAPLASTARRLFPEAFAELDGAAGGPFPFPPELLDSAHARWTAEWLAWERTHDAEYRLKVAAIEQEIDRHGASGAAAARARVAEIEREKLERYQQRYEEYVKTAKALATLGAGQPR